MKTVLITGASRGIGAVTALLFAEHNYKVAINYNKNAAPAQQLAEKIIENGGTAIAVQADISKRENVDHLFSQTEKSLGSVDILINNAGIAQQKLFTDLTDEDWDRMFEVDMRGMFLCSQRALSHMIHQKCGNIINISSMWGQVGASCEVHYSAAKAAAIGFTKALAKELGPSGIRVNCIAPGVINTEMNHNLSPETLSELAEETPLETLGTPKDIANAALFFASEKASFITGQILGVNGGFII